MSKALPTTAFEHKQLELISHDLMRQPKLPLLSPTVLPMNCVLLHVTEVNEEKPSAYQAAMSNVLAVMQGRTNVRIVYLLKGDHERVGLYIGVAATEQSRTDLYEQQKNLSAALKGHLPGIEIQPTALAEVDARWSDYQHFGVALGIPTCHEDRDKTDDEDFQGIERLIRAMQSSGNHWQLLLTAKPMSRVAIEELIEEVMTLSSRAASLSKITHQMSSNTSQQVTAGSNSSVAKGTNSSEANQEGKNEGGTTGGSKGSSDSGSYHSTNQGTNWSKNLGKSESKTITHGESDSTTTGQSLSAAKTIGDNSGVNLEYHDKRNQYLVTHYDEQLLPRLRKGMNKGLFQCAMYLSASDRATYQLLAAEVRSTFQGDVGTLSPIEVFDLGTVPKKIADLLELPQGNLHLSREKALTHGLEKISQNSQNSKLASVLSVEEVALLASLPRHEVPGIVRRKNVDFAVSLPAVSMAERISLGQLVDHGRKLEVDINFDPQELDKHVFVTGVTGAGKTTTCMKLLLESKLPFLVIEPAKTEYRALLNLESPESIDCYRPVDDPHQSFRINPFQLVSRQQKILPQISMILEVLSAAFPFEASMPQLVEQAIKRAYEAYGWDVDHNENYLVKDAWKAGAQVWPTFSDMIAQLDAIIPEQNMGKEFEEKYRGSLVSRLSGLTRGVVGVILDTPFSTDFEQLIECRVIVELENLPSAEHKAILMGLILHRLADVIKNRYRQQPIERFQHLTLIEEAHRLLARPEPGESASRKNAVETFANLLSEVRKYGEGLIIADQIPNKLVSDVIKNTHIKIVHRLLAEDDRRTVGEAMMLNEAQRGFLPNLQAGEAVVFRGGWHGAARVRIAQTVRTDDAPIAEAVLEEQAVQLFWRQRHALYPHLAVQWEGDDAQAFGQCVLLGRKLFNTLLAVASLYPAQKPSQARLTAQIVRLRQLLQQSHALLADTETLAAYWLCLLQDSRPRLRSNAKGQVWSAAYGQDAVDCLMRLWTVWAEAPLGDTAAIFECWASERQEKNALLAFSVFESI